MDAQMLVRDATLITALAQMVVLASSGRNCEIAAFVVRTTEGSLELVAWPPGCEAFQTHFVGRVPRGAVALAHTHPGKRWQPSSQDFDAAQNLGIPVLVLTRRGIMTTGSAADTPEWLLDDFTWTMPQRPSTDVEAARSHPS